MHAQSHSHPCSKRLPTACIYIDLVECIYVAKNTPHCSGGRRVSLSIYSMASRGLAPRVVLPQTGVTAGHTPPPAHGRTHAPRGVVIARFGEVGGGLTDSLRARTAGLMGARVAGAARAPLARIAPVRWNRPLAS